MNGTVMGYADRRSMRAGEQIAFKVSGDGISRYHARVVRLYAPEVGGPPHMPGYGAEPVSSTIEGVYPARFQPLDPGSHIRVPTLHLPAEAFTFTARIYPTLLSAGDQILISDLAPDGTGGLAIGLDRHGRFWVRTGGPTDTETTVVPCSVAEKRWSAIVMSIDPATGRIDASVSEISGHRLEAPRRMQCQAQCVPPGGTGQSLRIAAGVDTDGLTHHPFNGKLERPRLLRGYTVAAEHGPLLELGPDRTAPSPALADWDFSQGIDTELVIDTSGNGHDGQLVHMPARGIGGSNWDTSQLDWRARPAHYGAIHFHDDDMIDACWETDFVLDVGADWASGCYAVELAAVAPETTDPETFFIPFFVRPAAGARTADAALLIPTCTYSAYANLRVRVTGQWNELIHGRLTVLDSTDMLMLRYRGLGLSTYDGHSDGSTVLYSGMDRPVTNFRPNGRIYKFCQDLLIVAWAEAAGFEIDVLTDEDLHAEGMEALAPYRTLITGSHPEYWTTSMMDSLETWLSGGGRMMYLGGNGFFWRTAYHTTRPGVVEVRRSGMEQLWAHAAGETVFSTQPEPGGTWAHAGRPPNLVAGVGFVTQGFDANSYYRKREDAADPRAAFVFEYVPEEIIGDFGALMGGAAGYEIDRHDESLGSPAHALVLASSENHSNLYDLMVGSVVDILPSADPTAPDALRADMVFFETAGGGAVFSVGSIAWCGSLSWNDYDNNVARITANVLRRFNSEEPFAIPA